MKFLLTPTNRGALDEDLLEDLRRCASATDSETLSSSQYQRIGRYHKRTFAKRFGSWSAALQLAGLKPGRQSHSTAISDAELFENIRAVWITLGRQPMYRELKSPVSRYSQKIYRSRFGTISNTLKQFVEWAASAGDDISGINRSAIAEAKSPEKPGRTALRRTSRDVNERQRFRILLRDGFRCLSCGVSPLHSSGVQLHVDHIVPWSDGGETTDANLGTKCSRCNLGKSNAFSA